MKNKIERLPMCDDTKHLWDIFWIKEKTPFEKREHGKPIFEKCSGSISVCRICGAISMYNKQLDKVIFGEPVLNLYE